MGRSPYIVDVFILNGHPKRGISLYMNPFICENGQRRFFTIMRVELLESGDISPCDSSRQL
jgi:hypothetical protein